MGSKGGGGFDAGPSIEYGNKALALQEQMYDDSVERTQPYYDTGTASLGKLADLLGIQGGSQRSRSQIYDELAPQYTTQQETAGNSMSNIFVDSNGRAYDFDNTPSSYAINAMRTNGGGYGDDWRAAYNKYQAGSEPVMQESINYDGLNSAVDDIYSNQSTPDGYGSLLQSFGMDQFQEDPGYQFRLDEGQKAIERSAAARGQYYDPSTVKALNDYNGNQANQTYGDAYNRYNNDQNNVFNRLAAVSGIGQTANASLNQAGQANATNAGSIYGQMGSAVQSAQNANASQPSMFSSLLGAGAQLGGSYLGGLGLAASDERVKKNIKKIGTENGHNIYEFSYIGDDKKYTGVMAQEVQETHPEAVVSIDGILHVDYSRIGVEMKEVA